MRNKLLCLTLLSVADAALTYCGIQMGFMSEGNPLMALLIENSPVYFFICKLGLTVFGCYILWLRRENIWAIKGTWFLLLVFGLLLCYHFTLYTRFLMEKL